MPRVSGRSAISRSVMPFTALLRTNTSTSVAGMSSSALSSTSGTRASTCSTSASRGPEIETMSPCFEHAVGVRLEDPVAAADALHEDAQAREQISHRLAGQAARGVDAVRADLDPPVGGEHAGLLPGLATAHLLLVLGAGGRQVHADAASARSAQARSPSRWCRRCTSRRSRSGSRRGRPWPARRGARGE